MRLSRLGLKRLGMMGGGGGGAADPTIYLLRDDFITPEAAPIASPRTCEPGPGTVTITDTANKLSISGGKMLMSAVTASNTDPKAVFANEAAYAAGGAWKMSFRTTDNGAFRTVTSQLGTQRRNANFNPLTGGVPSGIGISNFKNGVDYQLYYMLVDNGTLMLLDDGSAITLLAANYALSGNLTVSTDNTGINLATDLVAYADLGAVFADYAYLATDHKATPQANDTIATAADGTVVVYWRPGAGQTLDIQVRRTDDNNCWIVRCDQAGSRIYLYDKQAGTETEQGATGGVAQTWSTSTYYCITINTLAQRIQACVNASQRINYTSAAFNETATGSKISLATSRFVAYPRIVPAAKLTHPFFA